MLSGLVGLLAGIGTLAVPGLGILVAAGPLLATLSGIGIGASVGGLAGGLIGLGIPEYEAKRYEGHLEQGGILVSVHCKDETDIERAKDILEAAGRPTSPWRGKRPPEVFHSARTARRSPSPLHA